MTDAAAAKGARRELADFARRRPELAARCRVIQNNLLLLEREPNNAGLLRMTAENVARLQTALSTRK